MKKWASTYACFSILSSLCWFNVVESSLSEVLAKHKKSSRDKFCRYDPAELLADPTWVDPGKLRDGGVVPQFGPLT